MKYLTIALLLFAQLYLPGTALAETDTRTQIEKVGVGNELLDYAIELDNGLVVALSHHRIFTCQKTNIMESLDTYWRPTRSTSIPASYKNCLYLTNRSAGLEVFKVANDGRISRTANLQKGSFFRMPIVRGKRLYDIAWDEAKRRTALFAYALDDPSEPSLLYTTAMPTMKALPSTLHLEGNRLYCVTPGKLWAFEIADSGEVTLLGELAFETNHIATGGMRINGKYAYVYTGRKLSTFDISVPAQMKQILSQDLSLRYVATGNEQGFFGIDSESLSEFAYCADRESGVREIRPHANTSMCFVPGPAGGFNIDGEGALSKRPFGGARSKNRVLGVGHQLALVAANDHLYVLGSEFQVFDIREPGEMKELLRDASIKASASRFQPIFHDGLIYASGSVIDVSSPLAPHVTEKYRLCKSVSIFGSLLYRASGTQYSVWRIRKKQPLKHLFTGNLKEAPRHVLLTAKHAFLSFDRKKVVAHSINRDYSLSPVADIILPGEDPYVVDLKSDGKMLYVAMNGAGTVSFDISDIEKLAPHSWRDTSQYSEKVFALQGRAFTAEGSGGVMVMDMVNPGQASILAEYPTCDWTYGLALYKGHIYTLEGQAGIGVFRCGALDANEPGDVDVYVDNVPRLSPGETRSIDELIDALGAGAFRTREGAQEKLEALLPGEAVLEYLEHCLKRAADPEIQYRLRDIVQP